MLSRMALWLGTLLAASALVPSAVRADSPGEVMMEVTDGIVSVSAADFLLRDSSGQDVSVKHLLDELNALRGLVQTLDDKTSTVSGSVQDAIDASTSKLRQQITTNKNKLDDIKTNGAKVLSDEVNQAINEAFDGLEVTANQARNTVVQGLSTKANSNAAKLVGLDDVKATVSRLSDGVDKLIEDAANVQACAKDAAHHVGDGECVPAVRQCEAPPALAGGKMELSDQHYIVPGVTASYSCDSSDFFVKGPSVRVCSHESYKFEPAQLPSCEQCLVADCLRCDGLETVCGVCKPGFDRTYGGKACVERKDTVIVIGYNIGGHNGQHSHSLAPGSTAWAEFKPKVNFNPIGGSGTITKEGTIYAVNRDGFGYYLRKGATGWASGLSAPYAGSKCCDQAYYVTASGVSDQADGLYHFAKTGSGLLKVATDGVTATWTPLNSPADIRFDGSTVIVDNKVYLLGGYSIAGKKAVDTVSIYDITQDPASGTYDDTSMKLPEPRNALAATHYGDKIYIFGGFLINKARTSSVKAYDLTSKTWTTLSSMPNPWATMTAGPIPTFANGEVLIPGAHSYDGPQTAVKYDINTDEWSFFIKARYWGGRYIALVGAR